jgi:hypothetical protein
MEGGGFIAKKRDLKDIDPLINPWTTYQISKNRLP